MRNSDIDPESEDESQIMASSSQRKTPSAVSSQSAIKGKSNQSLPEKSTIVKDIEAQKGNGQRKVRKSCVS